MIPNTEYKVEVKSKNSIGVSDGVAGTTVTTQSLSIPVPVISYNKESKVLTAALDSASDLCVIVEVGS